LNLCCTRNHNDYNEYYYFYYIHYDFSQTTNERGKQKSEGEIVFLSRCKRKYVSFHTFIIAMCVHMYVAKVRVKSQAIKEHLHVYNRLPYGKCFSTLSTVTRNRNNYDFLKAFVRYFLLFLFLLCCNRILYQVIDLK
jgi:hypothetical protein